ncbi:hypothetical protein PMAYCL1PPCAC_26438, partial [Pristionchus mayeri]
YLQHLNSLFLRTMNSDNNVSKDTPMVADLKKQLATIGRIAEVSLQDISEDKKRDGKTIEELSRKVTQSEKTTEGMKKRVSDLTTLLAQERNRAN